LKVYGRLAMTMRIGALARQVGLTTSALRYYEQAGLLPAAVRSEAGYRLYGQEAAGRLGFIRRAQALGLTIGEIRGLLEEPQGDAAVERARLRHVVAHRVADTDRRLRELVELKAELEDMQVRLLRTPGPDCGHVGDCACWLPTQEEVRAMTKDVRAAEDCCCCDCPDCDCCCAGGGGGSPTAT
jgi:DNA-binding transcriptional MerR regulator